jgi:hypothetical protein
MVRKADKPKRGPKPTGNAMKGRATAVCSIREQAAFEVAATEAKMRLSSWMRQAAIAALPPEVQEALKQQQ